ncbi:hypothetical protein CR513_26578, partial [Mucuna pruriens]
MVHITLSCPSATVWIVSFIKGDFGITNMLYTSSMVGRESGLSFKQANATFAMKITSLTTGIIGRGSRWSSTSFNSKLDVEEVEYIEEMRSPGCFPIIISKQSTP